MLVVTVVNLDKEDETMADLIFNELGFPVLLLNVPVVEVRGQALPDVNMKALQAVVFAMLVTKSARLTGAEVRFVRKHLRLRQADLAQVLNMANHSVVSQWESREDEPTGMDYNTEVLLRLWMAGRSGQGDRILELLETTLKNLESKGHPLEIHPHRAA